MQKLFLVSLSLAASVAMAAPEVHFETPTGEFYVMDLGNSTLIKDVNIGWQEIPLVLSRDFGMHKSFKNFENIEIHVVHYQNGAWSVDIEYPDGKNKEHIQLNAQGALVERVRVWRDNGPRYIILGKPTSVHPFD